VAGVKLFPVYKVLALIVGVLLLALTVGMGLKYGLTEGTVWQVRGDDLTSMVALAHGWIYIVYVIVAFMLSQRAGWKLSFLVLLLLAGLVPVLIFFVERKVEARLRAEAPELVS
jgi:integral membrane protein